MLNNIAIELPPIKEEAKRGELLRIAEKHWEMNSSRTIWYIGKLIKVKKNVENS